MATTVFFLPNVHPAAGFYYRQSPREPILPAGSNDFLTVTDVVALPNNTIETLLAAIVTARVEKKGTIIVVSHGTDAGLSFTLGRGRSAPFNAQALRVLRENFAGRLSDFEAAKRLRFGAFNAASNPDGVADLAALKAAMEPVRRLELARVELRACTTGKNADTMRHIQFFFNADLCCAPNAFDTFGPIPTARVTRNPQEWAAFRQRFGRFPNSTLIGAAGQRFWLVYQVNNAELRVMLDSIADTPEAVDAWVARHLPPGTTHSAGAPLHYHGLNPDRRPNIVFAGEAAYRDYLFAVTDGRESTVKVETGLPLPGRAP